MQSLGSSCASRAGLPACLQVRVDVWERSSTWPMGHVGRTLGRINDMRAETDALLVQAGIVHQVGGRSRHGSSLYRPVICLQLICLYVMPTLYKGSTHAE